MQYPRAAHCPAHGLCWTLGLHGLLRRWPRVGRPMGQGELASFAGKPSTKGHHRAALWSIQGDAEFYSKVLKVGPPDKSVKILKASEQDYKYVSPAEALLAKKNNHVLFGIPAVSTAVIRVMPCTYCIARVLGRTWQAACYITWPSTIGLTGRKSQPPRGSK